ncbi:hypothetical protein ACJJTC_017791 [Scirpophaga incertulas]
MYRQVFLLPSAGCTYGGKCQGRARSLPLTQVMRLPPPYSIPLENLSLVRRHGRVREPLIAKAGLLSPRSTSYRSRGADGFWSEALRKAKFGESEKCTGLVLPQECLCARAETLRSKQTYVHLFEFTHRPLTKLALTAHRCAENEWYAKKVLHKMDTHVDDPDPLSKVPRARVTPKPR